MINVDSGTRLLKGLTEACKWCDRLYTATMYRRSTLFTVQWPCKCQCVSIHDITYWEWTKSEPMVICFQSESIWPEYRDYCIRRAKDGCKVMLKINRKGLYRVWGKRTLKSRQASQTHYWTHKHIYGPRDYLESQGVPCQYNDWPDNNKAGHVDKPPPTKKKSLNGGPCNCCNPDIPCSGASGFYWADPFTCTCCPK